MNLNTVKILQAIISAGTSSEQSMVDMRIVFQNDVEFIIHSMQVSDGYASNPLNAATIQNLKANIFNVIGIGKVYNTTDGYNTIFDILNEVDSDIDDLFLDGVTIYTEYNAVGIVAIGGTVNVPVASWVTTNDSDGYDYIIASDEDMDNVVANGNVAASSTPSLNLTGLSLTNGNYYITVANHNNNTTPSKAVAFTVAIPTVALGSVTLHSGNADYDFTTTNGTSTNSLQLQWNNGGTWTNFGAASTNVTTSGTKSAITNPNTGATSVRARLTVNGTVYTSNTVIPVLTA